MRVEELNYARIFVLSISLVQKLWRRFYGGEHIVYKQRSNKLFTLNAKEYRLGCNNKSFHQFKKTIRNIRRKKKKKKTKQKTFYEYNNISSST